MKKSWLGLSLVANIILLGAVLALTLGRREKPASSSAPATSPASRAGQPASSVPAEEFAAESFSTEPGGQQSDASSAGGSPASRRDLRQLVAALRKAGWPEENLMPVVTSDFWQKRQKEQRELSRKMRRGEVDPKAMTDFYQRWQDESKAEVDSVLGAGTYERWEKKNMMQMFEMDGQELDAATADKLYVLQKDWQKKNQSRGTAYQSADFDQEKYQREWMRQQLDYERKLKEVLGEDRYALYKVGQSGGYYGSGNQLTGLQLSDQQRMAAARVMMEFSEQQQELNQLNQAGQIDPQDYQEQQRQLQQEQAGQLKQVLGPDALLRYQQNNDYDFRRIRGELREQNFSDAQIDAAFRARQAFNDRQQDLQKQAQEGGLKGDEYPASQATFDQDLKNALGDQGYLSYQKTQDYKYRQMKQYAPVWQLSQTDIDTVWESVHEYQVAVQDYQKQNQAAVKQGQQVDWQQVQQETTKLTEETEADLRRYLGDDRFEKLQRSGIIQLGQGGRRTGRRGSSTIIVPGGQTIFVPAN